MNFFKPFFKQLVRLNVNNTIINNHKLLTFRRKKWLKFLLQLKQQLIRSKFKLIDQNKILLNIHSNKFNSYSNTYKFYFSFLRNLKHIYLKLKPFKLNRLKIVLNHLEQRIDIVLIRSKFCLTLRAAKKLISLGYVFVNKYKIIIKSYILSSGDFVKIKLYSLDLFKQYLIKSFKWCVPANNLIINYATKELLVLNLFKLLNNFILYFPYYLNLKIII